MQQEVQTGGNECKPHDRHPIPVSAAAQAANPELSMTQIQQLTALAFARDGPEHTAGPAATSAAAATQTTTANAAADEAAHSTAAGVAAAAVQEQPAPLSMPADEAVVVAGNPVFRSQHSRGDQAAESDSARGGTAEGTRRAGSGAAAAAADFADARSDGSEWASAFIAEARRQNEATITALTGLSGWQYQKSPKNYAGFSTLLYQLHADFVTPHCMTHHAVSHYMVSTASAIGTVAQPVLHCDDPHLCARQQTT